MDAVVTTQQPSTFWASVREALRGSHQDYTTGSINRAIFLLAIPMVLEMLMEALFAVVDIFWVARLGADAVATVGLVESLMTLVYAVAMGLGLSPPPWWRGGWVKRIATERPRQACKLSASECSRAW